MKVVAPINVTFVVYEVVRLMIIVVLFGWFLTVQLFEKSRRSHEDLSVT